MELSRLAAAVAGELQFRCAEAARIVLASLKAQGKILACGNGGSAADAQHFAAELVGRMCVERRALAAVTLSSDPSIVTALGNDYGFASVFARQVEALGRPGDVLVALSTSGRSPNVIRALETACSRGLHTIALVGEDRGDLSAVTDVLISIPSRETPRIQELHTAALHAICQLVEQCVFAAKEGWAL
jgi:D-sedoheptulose 7-phosphate isomerase